MADVTPIGSKLHQRRDEVLRRLLAAQNAGDIDASLACFAQPRYELIGNTRVYDGADEVRHYYEVTRRYFPDLHFDVIDVHHGDDAVMCELWMTGTHLGSGRDFDATGRCFRCRTAIIFSFAGEALTGARVYYDTGTIARQLA
ncbi:MAG: ester cyclase [Acidimicrobiales bacterium]